MFDHSFPTMHLIFAEELGGKSSIDIDLLLLEKQLKKQEESLIVLLLFCVLVFV